MIVWCSFVLTKSIKFQATKNYNQQKTALAIKMNYHPLNKPNFNRLDNNSPTERLRKNGPSLEPKTQPRQLRPNRTYSKNAVSELYPPNPQTSFYIPQANRSPNYCTLRKARRPSQAMCTLKTQLATLKEEIGKLISVDEHQDSRRQSFGNYSNRLEDKYMQEGSTASVAQSILYNPSRDYSLQNPQYSHNNHLLLQNQSLKLQIQKLHSRLTFQQGDHSQQIHSMTLKMHQLESMLANTQLEESRLVEEEVHRLRQELATGRERELNNREIEASLQEIIKARDIEIRGKQLQLDNVNAELHRVKGVLEGRDADERKAKNQMVQLKEALNLRENQIKELYHKQKRGENDQLNKVKDELQKVNRILQQKETQIRQLQNSNRKGSSDKEQLKRTTESLQAKELELREFKAQKHTQMKQLYQKGIFDKQQITNLQSIVNQKDMQLRQLHEKRTADRQQITKIKQQLHTKQAEIKKLQASNNKEMTQAKKQQENEAEQLRIQLQTAKAIADKKQKQLQSFIARKQQQLRMQNTATSSQVVTLQNFVSSLKQQLSVNQLRISELEKIIENQRRQNQNLADSRTLRKQSESSIKTELDNTIKRLVAQQDLYKKSIEELEKSKSNMKVEIASLSQQIQIKSQALKKAQSEANKSQDNIKYLSGQVQVLTNSKTQSQKLADEVARINQYYETQIQQIQAQNNKIVNDLNRKVEQITRTNLDKVKEINELTDKLKTVRNQLDSVKQELHKAKLYIDDMSINHDISTREHQQLQHNLNEKQQELSDYRNKVQTLEMQLTLQRQTNQSLKQKIDHLQSLSGKDIQQARILLQQQHAIRELEVKVNSLQETEKKTNQQLGSSRMRCDHQLKLLSEKENQLKEKSEELRNLELFHKRQIDEMKEEMQRWLRSERRLDQGELITKLEEKLKEQEKNYDSIIEDLKSQLRQRNIDDMSKSRSSMSDMETLDEAFKGQNEEIVSLRTELRQRTAQMQRLKDNLVKTSTQFSNLKSLYEVEKVKFMSEKNNSSAAIQSQIQNLKHDISLEKRNNEALAQKLKYLTEENRKKDAFINSYIVSKKISPEDKQQVKQFFQKYQAEFSLEKIRANLQKEFLQIQKLTKTNQQLTEQLTKMTPLQ